MPRGTGRRSYTPPPMGCPRPLLAACAAATLFSSPAAGGADPAPAAWKLGPSDLARYTTKSVKRKGGDTIVDDGDPVYFHGHDLRDGGLYLPVGLRREDLPALFSLRTPAPGPFEWKLRLADTLDLRVQGTASAKDAADALELTVDATFASTGRAGDFDEYVLRDGQAHAKVVFDRAAGVVKSGHVEVKYVREKADGKRTDRPAAVSETWDHALAGVTALGYAQFPADVNAAIDRGVAQLRKLQKDDGRFEPYEGQDLGTTALCAYTLVSCGVPAADPAVEKALSVVFAGKPLRTYEQAVSLMAIERAYTPPEEIADPRRGEGRKPPRDLPPERRAWCVLTAAALESGCSAPGTWGYPNAGWDLNRADTSNTQYAVLGLQAAARLGIAVKESTWLGVLRHFAQAREADGPKTTVAILRAGHAVTEAPETFAVPRATGFRYRPNERRTWGSMTCAGIASLAIARDELRRAKRLAQKADDETGASILAAWAWLDLHWAADRNPEKPGDSWYYYFLYCLERAAILDGVQRVGGRDWYFEGAAELLARQAKDGSWDEPGGVHTTETCFALLFLKRATAPLTPR
jgi:hypothetical protein